MMEIVGEFYLKKLKDYHQETYEHSLNVASSCKYLAEVNFLTKLEIDLAYNSGLLHDIGKLNIPLEILTKRDKLEDNEREIIKSHVRKGFLILKEDCFKDIRKIMIRHHEFSKSPYPREISDRRRKKRINERRREEEFSKLGQILAASDMFCALSTARAYKESFKAEEVRRILISEFTGDHRYIEQLMSRK